jgi:hypothetical protein
MKELELAETYQAKRAADRRGERVENIHRWIQPSREPVVFPLKSTKPGNLLS